MSWPFRVCSKFQSPVERLLLGPDCTSSFFFCRDIVRLPLTIITIIYSVSVPKPHTPLTCWAPAQSNAAHFAARKESEGGLVLKTWAFEITVAFANVVKALLSWHFLHLLLFLLIVVFKTSILLFALVEVPVFVLEFCIGHCREDRKSNIKY